MSPEDIAKAQLYAEDDRTIQTCILVHYGWDFDVADALPDYQRFAYVVIYKQMYENLIYLWDQRRWIVRPPPKTQKI